MKQQWHYYFKLPIALVVIASCSLISTDLHILKHPWLSVPQQDLQDPPPNLRDEVARENRRRPPSVACFLMTSAKDFDYAVAVRYSIWGTRCAKFAIVTNNDLDPLGNANNPHQQPWLRMDEDTYILDISTIIQQELSRLNYPVVDGITSRAGGDKEHPLNYITFPAPDRETKDTLALKVFYSWLAMANIFLKDSNIDYVMKVDHDTYMLMDNHLNYLQENFLPNQHAYIGRVFKADNDHHRPFVSGLSVTLSRATLQLFYQQASIDGTANKCSAKEFGVWYRALEDFAMSECLQSLGVYPSHTRDEQGYERFFHFDPEMHRSSPIEAFPEWYRKFSFGRGGDQQPTTCCSAETCAFHYVRRELQNDTLVYKATNDRHQQGGFWYWQSKGVKQS